MEWTNRIPAPCAEHKAHASAVRPVRAVVPEIDDRIGEGFECVVQLTEALEAKQQPAELENHLAGLPPPPPAGDGVKVSLHRTL
jgi:hypothetical protein